MSTITLFTNRDAFAPAWKNALAELGYGVRVTTPDQINTVGPRDAIIIDADADEFGEDELLTAIGFARAVGAHPIVQVPDGGKLADVEDVIDDMCHGMVARSAADVTRLAASLGRRLDQDRATRFEFVTVSPREGEVLAILGDGSSALLRRPLHKDDDRTDIVAITLDDDAQTATLSLTSETTLTLHVKDVLARGRADIPIDGARLGARLRELRLEAGLTQAELARRTGIHRPNIARVEAGRHTPSLETLARIATAIGVPTTRVLSED